MRFGLILLASATLFAADAKKNLSDAEIDGIIQKFAAKEAAFAQARDNYVYRQTARIQELDDAGNTTGRWEMVSDIVFSSDGKRTEHVVRSPVPTLHQILLTPEDMEDLRSVQPFVLHNQRAAELLDPLPGPSAGGRNRDLRFRGQAEESRGSETLLFRRGLGGRSRSADREELRPRVGTANRKENNAFPKFETYREQIDGKYWFPTYTIANDTLHFKDNDVRIKQTVKYEDYKQFKSDVKITFGDVVDDPNKKDNKPPVKKQQQQ